MFKRIVTRVLKQDTYEKPIGRWFRDSCEIKIARKVDLTNEDHCGPCGQYKKVEIDVQNIPSKALDHLEKKVLK